jgi:single-strand DNA-binding protein
MTRLFLATIRRYQDAQQRWQEKTQWHTCVAYGPAAHYVAQIPTGAHVWLEGELVQREGKRTVQTDHGPIQVTWPITEVVITSLTLLDRPELPALSKTGSTSSVDGRHNEAPGF